MACWRDRTEAGRQLAKALAAYAGQEAIVYGLPRGGVVLAVEVAREIGAPLSVVIARKIGHPLHPEYAIGAVSETGQPVINESEAATLSHDWLKKETAAQRGESKRRRETFLEGGQPPSAKGKIAILVDDGVATGYTLRAAITEVKAQKPKKLVVAVPVIPDDTAEEVEKEVDDLVVLKREKHYRGAVGAYYDNFKQVEDNEVMDLLAGSDH